ncbi:MAG: thioredoxin domain-containing protein [Pseudomonadota bacterium]|nr:thioredoxin domain-containing protein [Pseudomonadota bacterium]
MRTIIAAIVFTLMFGLFCASFASPPEGAAATAQPQLPADVKPKTDVPNSPSAMPEEKMTTPVPGAPEPNLRAPRPENSYLIKDAPLPGDYVMGKTSAPLIMIEYASMSCPHCAHFSNTVLPELQKRYIETGQMRYILRQFPLNEPALKGAMLLDCVGDQNKEKYFTFAKVLFETQSKWAFDTNFLSNLETIATVGGLSKDQFQHCVNDTEREMKVLKAKKLAEDELKVPHTPYILIGGVPYEGDRSVDAMSAAIDTQLAKALR